MVTLGFEPGHSDLSPDSYSYLQYRCPSIYIFLIYMVDIFPVSTHINILFGAGKNLNNFKLF